MFPHLIHDCDGGALARCTGRLRGHSERVDQCLWMMFADIYEEVVDIPANILAWCLDAGNDLIRKIKISKM